MIRVVWSGANQGEERGQHWHPTQKSIAVMRQIIETVSRPDDTILDLYMESGTTGITALRTGRKFIGDEIERRWFRVATTRLHREFHARKQ
ncbi:MAG: site-specific DNA-methyltransferase [Alphaproteobacteria bacterium]|nr:site-specific DNA-methyltransferase [Alphaproteobacteria bacterium]